MTKYTNYHVHVTWQPRGTGYVVEECLGVFSSREEAEAFIDEKLKEFNFYNLSPSEIERFKRAYLAQPEKIDPAVIWEPFVCIPSDIPPDAICPEVK